MEKMKNTYSDILSRLPKADCPKDKKSYNIPDRKTYANRLRAALTARMSGCTLGAPVEGWTLDAIEAYAKKLGLEYPLTDYLTDIPNPEDKRYSIQAFKDYTRPHIKAVPCDDDVGYTLLSLFIAEESGKGVDFELSDVAAAWLKYITVSYTAEEVAMRNMQNGVDIYKAAEIDNPYDELIGADIRCDGYGYLAPGNPELAAKMAFTDAYISHRKNGIYGSMYFAAVISIAFAVGDPKQAFIDGLNYIPDDCELADGIKWALANYATVRDYRHAAELVDERYPGMHNVHTINNACLTVFAFSLAEKDDAIKAFGANNAAAAFSNCVAMAHDNDCTAATAGSIAGACWGMDSIGSHWYSCFNNTINSYFNGPSSYQIDDILKRYEKLAVLD